MGTQFWLVKRTQVFQTPYRVGGCARQLFLSQRHTIDTLRTPMPQDDLAPL